MGAEKTNWTWLFGGVMAAIGVGSVLYRFTCLGFLWSGPGSTALFFLWVVVFGAAGAFRGSYGARPPAWTIVVVAVIGLAAGGALSFAIAPPLSQIRLHDRELPGLTIALPSGEEKEKANVRSYATGKLVLPRIGGFDAVTLVTWEVGGIPDSEELAILVRAEAAAIGASLRPGAAGAIAVGGRLPQRSLLLSSGDIPGVQTVFPCGARRFIVLTLGKRTEALHARILASVRCHPDAAQETAVDAVPVVLHLPPGWKAQPTERGQLLVVSKEEDAALLVRPLAGTIDPATIEKLLPTLGGAMNGTLTLGAMRTERSRGFWSGTMVIDAEKLNVLVSPCPCPDRALTLLLLFLYQPGGDETAGHELLLDAHCPATGEKIPDYVKPAN